LPCNLSHDARLCGEFSTESNDLAGELKRAFPEIVRLLENHGELAIAISEPAS
jgi:hypothetical protein